jgi:hypothetical protein
MTLTGLQKTLEQVAKETPEIMDKDCKVRRVGPQGQTDWMLVDVVRIQKEPELELIFEFN